MGLLDPIRSLLGVDGSPSLQKLADEPYICVSCRQTYKEQYQSCPECNGLVVANEDTGDEPRIPW